MKRSVFSLVLILLLVLVIVAASIFILRGTPNGEGGKSAGPAATVAPPRDSAAPATADPGTAPSDPTAPPQQTAQPADGTPQPTEPTPEPTAEPTPEPTAEPTPTPPPADAEGSFSSSTGTGLNLRVDWRSFTAADGTRKLTVEVNLISYSLAAFAQNKSITMKIGDKSWSADFAGVVYEGDEQIVTPMAAFTVDAPAPGTAIAVDWYYGGVYSGKVLDVISAQGVIQ